MTDRLIAETQAQFNAQPPGPNPSCDFSGRPLWVKYLADPTPNQIVREYHLASELHKIVSTSSETCMERVLQELSYFSDSSPIQTRVRSFLAVMKKNPDASTDLLNKAELKKRFPEVIFNGSLDQILISAGVVFNGKVTIEGKVLIFGPVIIGPDVTLQGEVVLLGGIRVGQSTLRGRVEGEDVSIFGSTLEQTGQVQGSHIGIEGASNIAGFVHGDEIQISGSTLARGTVVRGKNHLLQNSILHRGAVVSGNYNTLQQVTLSNNVSLEGAGNSHLQKTEIGSDSEIDLDQAELFRCQIPSGEELDLHKKRCEGDLDYRGVCKNGSPNQTAGPDRVSKSPPL